MTEMVETVPFQPPYLGSWEDFEVYVAQIVAVPLPRVKRYWEYNHRYYHSSQKYIE